MKRFLQFFLLRFVLTHCQSNLPLCPPSVQFIPPGVPLNCIPSKSNNPPQFPFTNLQQMFPMLKYMSSPTPGRKEMEFSLAGGSTMSPPMGSMVQPMMNFSPGQMSNMMMPQQQIQGGPSNQPMNPPPAPPQPNPVITVPGSAGVSDPLAGQAQPPMSQTQPRGQFMMNDSPNVKANSLMSMPFYSQNGRTDSKEIRPDLLKSDDEERSGEKETDDPINKFSKMSDDPSRSSGNSKRLVVSPVLAYVTKDGHIMYQKKLNDIDALYWLKKEMTDKKEDDAAAKNLKRLLQGHKGFGEKRASKNFNSKFRKNEQKDDELRQDPNRHYAELPLNGNRRRERSTSTGKRKNYKQNYKTLIPGTPDNNFEYVKGI